MKIVDQKKAGMCGVMAMALLLIAGTACAQSVGGDKGKIKEMKGQGKEHAVEMFKKLNLSKEQQAQMDGNREKHRAEFEAMKKQMSDKREALRKVLDAEMLDMKAVQAAHQELKDLILKMEDYHLAAVLEIRQVLTPEQFKQFQAMAPKGGPKGEGRKEGRGGFHGEGKGEVEEQHPPMADGK